MTQAAALLIFTAVSTGVSLLFALMEGVLTSHAAWLSLMAGGIAGLYVLFGVKGLDSGQASPGKFDYVMFFCFLLFCLRHFLWIYFHKGGEIWTLNSRHNYSDLPMHLTYIQNIVEGIKFWPTNPLFVGEKLHYHFGMDLFTALFVKIGVPLEHALPLIGVVAGILTMATLFWWGRGFTVGAFLFSGGVAGFLYFTTGHFDDYQADLAWKSVPLTLFIPQRGFLYGFPAGLLVLSSWRKRFLEGRPGLPAIVEGTLWGMMPFFQANTFVFLSAVFLFWTVLTRKVREALLVYFVAIVPATFLMLKLTNNFQKASMIWLKPGWLIEDQHPLAFFWINFGFFVPLVLWAIFVALKKRDRVSILMMLPAAVMFGICMFVMFLPNPWDNVKFVVWSYLIMMPLVDKYAIQRLRWSLRLPLLLVLFFSGFVCLMSLTGGWHRGAPLIDLEEYDGVCHAVKDLPQEARFATYQDFKHPVALCGHQLVAGWNGHVWVHGIQPRPVEEKLARLMEGEFDWREMAAQLKTRYLFWGHREEEHFKNSNRPWEAESLKVAEGPWGKIYDLTQPSSLVTCMPQKLLEGRFGLQASYYDNVEVKGKPVNIETHVLPSFDWNEETRPLKPPFGIVFEGEIFVPEAGEIVFGLASDDGSILEIDGEMVVDNSGVHPLRVRRGKVKLEKGWHALRIQYNDIGGSATLRLWWQLPEGREESIPFQYFRMEEIVP